MIRMCLSAEHHNIQTIIRDDALGLTPVHVCRTLDKPRKDGVVEIRHGRLRIVDADALAEDASEYHDEDDDRLLMY